jgi:hypothetical protein
MRNLNQVLQPVEGKMSIKGIIEDRWWCALCTSDQKWIKMRMKTLIHFDSKDEIITRCLFDIRSCFFLSVIIIDTCYIIFVRIKLTMIMFIKVWKLFLVIRISTRCQVWLGKRWETSLWTCVSLSKTIATTVF